MCSSRFMNGSFADTQCWVCRRATRATTVLDDDDDAGPSGGAENGDTSNTLPKVGQKRTPAGTAPKRSGRVSEAPPAADGNAIMKLDAATEQTLCDAVNDMLVEQRYVDEWKIDGIARWLQASKGITISEKLLEEYMDRVDQNLPAKVPHVLYDLAEQTVHRDY